MSNEPVTMVYLVESSVDSERQLVGSTPELAEGLAKREREALGFDWERLDGTGQILFEADEAPELSVTITTVTLDSEVRHGE